MMKPGLIERYVVYRRVNTQETSSKEVLVVVIKFGTNLNGHQGIVHGGVISLVLDDAMGFAYEAIGIPVAFTANLSVNYRRPLPAGASTVLRVCHTKTDGRKIYFEGQLTDPDGSVLYAEGTSLYVVPRAAS